ncbi:MAG TPA: hypothetical protein VH640_20470 [Bryobacteraceae bacterium]
MDVFNGIVNAMLRLFFGAFSWAGANAALLSLTMLSMLAGVGMLWVFRKTSDQAAIRAVKRKVHAYLLEMRVYADDPGATWRAQNSLIKANLRYIGLALRPALLMVVPVGVLLIHMEGFYGRAPLEPGRSVVVTAVLGGGADGPAPQLVPPRGFQVSALPVRIPEQGEVSWRIVPERAASGELHFQIGGQRFTKKIEAGGGQRFIAERRVRSVWEAFWHPDEPRLPAGKIEWVEVAYPAASMAIFGMRINWLVWFVVVSMLAALVFRKRFGVTL